MILGQADGEGLAPRQHTGIRIVADFQIQCTKRPAPPRTYGLQGTKVLNSDRVFIRMAQSFTESFADGILERQTVILTDIRTTRRGEREGNTDLIQ
jgi:hypothetical protein